MAKPILTNSSDYNRFLQQKEFAVAPAGIATEGMTFPDFLFDYQKYCLKFSLELGRSAQFLGCGLGKTAIQLSWANIVAEHTGKPVLILAPLAVSKQTAAIESKKFGIFVTLCESAADVAAGINITNYEKLEKFDPSVFGAVVLDESGILKGFTSKTRNAIIEAFRSTPYKLACTATPAPNDFMELGNHAEFLGIMSYNEMLCSFFTHDGGNTSQWVLKKHARAKFWKWVSGWAIVAEKPNHLGYDDEKFILPPLNQTEIKIETGIRLDGELFVTEARTLNERREAKRLTIDRRVAEVAKLVNNSDEQWLVWCHLNDESEALAKAIADAVEVKGSDSDKHKENALIGFVDGSIRVLISKASIFGFGVNFQCCHNVVFIGLDDSFESLYQAIRRCWRFGQTETVNVHIVTTDVEGNVLANIQRKEKQFQEMLAGMAREINGDQCLSRTSRQTDDYLPINPMPLPNWISDSASDLKVLDSQIGDRHALYHGDSCEIVKGIPNESIDFTVTSIPFSNLYCYSNSPRDLGNAKTDEDFEGHFDFLISELFRVTRTGRLIAIHCMNLPAMKQRDGFIGLKDLRGDVIRWFQKAGFIYHSEVCIWKDPVVAVTRTKAIGLLHKQLVKDSAKSRQGIPDYLVVFRKPGENAEPIAGPLTEYHGEESLSLSKNETERSIQIWQKYASPVWFDINMSDTLQYMTAKDEDDQKHIAPLQLEVIRRSIQLWTNPGDVVLDPFNGIGSSGYVAIEMGRKYVGIELKKSYFEVAKKNLDFIEKKPEQRSLLELIG